MNRLFLMILMVMLTVSCGANQSKEDKNFVIKTDKARLVVGNNVKKFSFISKPQHTTNLSFRVGGQVKNFDTYVGNYFKKGDVIAEIDDRDFIIRKERAEGQYFQSKAEYERIKNLFEKKNISASTYDKAYADYISAKTSYEIANNELLDTKLIAPFDGYINQIYIEQYQDVKATQSIVTLVDIEQIRIEVYVSQDIAIKAQNIKDVSLCFDINPEKMYYAKVADISKNTSDNNLSYLLTALLSNKNGDLLPGMSGEVSFVSEKTDSVIVIPQTALSHRPTEGDYIWCVDTVLWNVSKRNIEIGRLLPRGNVEVYGEIKKGEQVVISGLRFLSEGLKVTIQD